MATDSGLATAKPRSEHLDLGLFHSLQWRVVDLKEGGSLEAIVDAVTAAFESYDPAMLENAWHALFSNQSSMLEHQGGNDFSIPNEGGRNVMRTGTMVEARCVNRQLVTCGHKISETHRWIEQLFCAPRKVTLGGLWDPLFSNLAFFLCFDLHIML